MRPKFILATATAAWAATSLGLGQAPSIPTTFNPTSSEPAPPAVTLPAPVVTPAPSASAAAPPSATPALPATVMSDAPPPAVAQDVAPQPPTPTPRPPKAAKAKKAPAAGSSTPAGSGSFGGGGSLRTDQDVMIQVEAPFVVTRQSGRGIDPDHAATEALGVGLMDEERDLNPQQALRKYQEVVARFDRQRASAAEAVFRLGECYRKLGRLEEAKVQYGRILREFADQPDLVRASTRYLFQEAAIQVKVTQPAKGAPPRANLQAVVARPHSSPDTPDLPTVQGEDETEVSTYTVTGVRGGGMMGGMGAGMGAGMGGGAMFGGAIAAPRGMFPADDGNLTSGLRTGRERRTQMVLVPAVPQPPESDPEADTPGGTASAGDEAARQSQPLLGAVTMELAGTHAQTDPLASRTEPRQRYGQRVQAAPPAPARLTRGTGENQFQRNLANILQRAAIPEALRPLQERLEDAQSELDLAKASLKTCEKQYAEWRRKLDLVANTQAELLPPPADADPEYAKLLEQYHSVLLSQPRDQTAKSEKERNLVETRAKLAQYVSDIYRPRTEVAVKAADKQRDQARLETEHAMARVEALRNELNAKLQAVDAKAREDADHAEARLKAAQTLNAELKAAQQEMQRMLNKPDSAPDGQKPSSTTPAPAGTPEK